MRLYETETELADAASFEASIGNYSLSDALRQASESMHNGDLTSAGWWLDAADQERQLVSELITA